MKKQYKLLLLIFIYANNISFGLEITNTEYQYEQNVSFDFHLENVTGTNKIYKTITKLVYENMDISDYIRYKSKKFVENHFNDLGVFYGENSKIVFLNDLFAVIRKTEVIHFADTWYRSITENYQIIDLENSKILSMEDLINKIPDEELKNFISASIDIMMTIYGITKE